ncbi:hypothetical protein MBLNU457_3074t1 [Dothideomycetes sp. NU457]
MQTKTSDDPFQLLERLFVDYAYKRYQRDIAPGYNRAKAMRLIPVSCSSSRKSSDSDDDDSTVNHLDALHHSLKSLETTHRPVQQLPPTPPSHDSDSNQEPLLESSMILEERQTPAHASSMRATTPNPTHDPPTPEITPPQTQKRSRPPRPSLLSTQSLSQAESFVTARESQSSAASSRTTLQLLDPQYHVRRQHVSKSDLRSMSRSYDHGSLDNDDTTTPTQSRSATPRLQQRAQGATGVENVSDVGASNDDFDSEFRRNVTVKRYRPRREDQTTAKAFAEQERPKICRKSLPKPSVVNENLPVAIKKDVSEDQGDWQNQVNNVLYSQLRDQKLKRLSGASATSSTLVEVIVLPAPSKPVQNLRHAGRNLALRDDFLSASGRSRVASEPAAAQQHRLRHRKSHIPERGSGDTASTNIRAVSSPMLSCKPPRNAVLANAKELGVRESNREQSKPILRKTQVGVPQPSHYYDQTKDGNPVHDKNVSSCTDAGERSGRARTSSGTRTGRNRTMEDQDLLSPERKPEQERPRKSSNAESTFSDDSRPARLHKHSGSASSIEYIPRGSFSAQRRRSSLDPSHLLPSNTPLSQQSQWSDRTDTLEVSEAKAVSIFPHTNHSLLVVQQRGGNDMTVDSYPQRSLTNGAYGHEHVLRDEPGYPNFRAIIDAPVNESTNNLSLINSPLTNPRAAPEPPLINFIPATPNEEVDRQLIPVEAVPEAEPKAKTPLTRRQSLAKRARRYSESVIGPLRTLSTGSRKRYTYVVRDDRSANLHPFWRPRGFWDDFDSEDDDYYDDEAPTGPLPQGGDTSDVEDRETFPRRMSRRMPGFRGAGGFLLGNSLGFTRHGTNNRRHYIDQSVVRHSSDSDSPVSGSRELRRRRSERMLRTIVSSTDSLRRRRMPEDGVSKRSRSARSIGLNEGMHAVSLRTFRKRLRQVREEKAERAAEKRRQELKAPPKSKDRGPASKEDTQTDFNAMDIFQGAPPPSTGIDACMPDGFTLNSGIKVVGSGVMLVAGEAFKWSPWLKAGRKEGTIGGGGTANDNKGVFSPGGKLQNARNQWEVDDHAWGVLDLVWPKPDLLILGTGPKILPVSPATRKAINNLGVRLEVQDTRNAAAQFNLLATERGVQEVAAAMIPIGWKEGS